ncbi:MOSC domain-containing protein [Nocardioides marinquilinus]|uniref:MOSC domain-containing protein n=1 Tax=Nocardioides marinquilinus TaxID=1210400 RepID=UPI0031F04C33
MTQRVVGLHVAKGRRLPTREVERVEVETGRGIVGDRYHGAKHRHVSVQSLDDLAEATRLHGADVPPGLTRRNVTLDHGEVPRTPGVRLRVGDPATGVLLEVVRVAAPCKLLDDTIGPGAQQALRRRGGTIFRVLEGGTIALGDEVVVLEAQDAAGSAGLTGSAGSAASAT